LPRPLLLRLSTRTLPDADHRRARRCHKTLHGFHQVVLKARAAQLPVGEDVYAKAALAFQHGQDGAIFNVVQLLQGQTSLAAGGSGLFHFGWPQETPHMVGAVDL
jgi:hypothetical protein